jgi:hypothetical protein
MIELENQETGWQRDSEVTDASDGSNALEIREEGA